MANIRDVTLAQIANSAFQDAPGALPGGLSPVSAGALGVVIDTPGESYVNGVYHLDNVAALVASGTLGGLDTLVVSFRGDDDRTDSINTLRNPAVDFAKFGELIAAVDKLAASGAFQQVAITGHSGGGSLTQLFMSAHPDGTTPVRYVATTTGSPGALIPDSADGRIQNFVIVDDPAVFLGENREDVGNALDNPLIGRAVAEVAARILPGLTVNDALDSIPTLTTDFENAGVTVLLPGKAGGTGQFTTVTGLLQADPGQHNISLYISEISDIALRLPGRGNEPLFDPAFYLAKNPDVAASGMDAQDHYDIYGWREGRDPSAVFDTSAYLAANPDVAAAGANPMIHYSTYGWHENRDPNALFDTSAYLALNTDVAAANIDPLTHYLQYGWSEGRNPGPAFDTSSYLAANPDVAAAGVNPLAHYLEFGINEGRVIA